MHILQSIQKIKYYLIMQLKLNEEKRNMFNK